MGTKVIDITVEIRSGNKSIKLNSEEAREVYDQLHDLFGKEYMYNPLPEIVQYPPYNPYNPSAPWVTYDTSAKKPE